MSLFKNAIFFTTVNDLKKLPDNPGEIAFVGRSNSGKSSAINTLTHHNRLAYVSKTPGRTQHINFFELQNGLFLADLPGYGYAQVPQSIRKHWEILLGRYLKERKNLLGLILIMDCRHPLRDKDILMLDYFESRDLPVHILLTKADKLSKNEQLKVLKKTKEDLINLAYSFPLSVQLFSSLKKAGMEEVDEVVSQWMNPYLIGDDKN